ncbi:MAG TPA: hypothetical protein VGJ32_11550 [Solirubrobacteraceae bacterium]|jgi:hypothetical protein
MTPRQIATNQAVMQCDVCGRTLLRGEQPAVFLAGGSRRNVCELCTPRATHEGWIREGLAVEELGVRQRGRERRGSLLARLRARRDGHPARRPAPPEPEPEPVPVPVIPREEYLAPPPPPEPRHVHAVPTNADMKRSRAVDVFNGSDRPRTVAALSRSLGAPFVVVRPSETEGAIVNIVVGWELCWYRYEVDLADEAAGVRQTAQGDELSELDPADTVPNAAADERGELQLVSV